MRVFVMRLLARVTGEKSEAMYVWHKCCRVPFLKRKKIERKDFQDRTRKLNKKFSGTRKQKIMQLCLKTLSGTFHWNVREKVPICPNRSCRGHRASRVRMDDGPRICGGASAGEYVQGHIACRVLSSLSQRGERWETSRT